MVGVHDQGVVLMEPRMHQAEGQPGEVRLRTVAVVVVLETVVAADRMIVVVAEVEVVDIDVVEMVVAAVGVVVVGRFLVHSVT